MSQYPWLLLAVYVVTIGSVQLLALWAATSTRPWLLRALIVWAPIALLATIRAYEPALVLLMSATLTIGLSFVIQRFGSKPSTAQRPRSRWRFRIADLIVLILLLGTWLGLAGNRNSLGYHLLLPVYVCLGAMPLALLSILAQRMVLGPRRGTMAALLLGLIWICALVLRFFNVPLFLGEGRPSLASYWPREEAVSAALHGAFPLAALVALGLAAFVWRRSADIRKSPVVWRVYVMTAAIATGVAIPLGWLFWDGFAWTLGFEKFSRSNLEVGIHSVFFFSLAAFIASITALTSAASQAEDARTRVLAARTLMTLCVLAGFPAAWIYWQMLWYAPYPRIEHDPVNHYDRIVAIARHMDQQKYLAALPPAIQSELDDVTTLLRHANYTPLELLRQDVSRTEPRRWLNGQEVQSLNYRLRDSAERAEAAGNHDLAADYAVAIIRFDAMIDRGGSSSYAYAGYELLARLRDKLSPAKARDVINMLDKTLAERYPAETVAALRMAQWERQLGWREKLRDAVGRRASNRHFDESAIEIETLNSRKPSETFNLLLRVDLAIRIFKRERRRLPKKLDELTPELLSAPAYDPYGEDFLVYRTTGDQFDLYSRGPDCVDDGGTVLKSVWHPDERGYDIGLDLKP